MPYLIEEENSTDVSGCENMVLAKARSQTFCQSTSKYLFASFSKMNAFLVDLSLFMAMLQVSQVYIYYAIGGRYTTRTGDQ